LLLALALAATGGWLHPVAGLPRGQSKARTAEKPSQDFSGAFEAYCGLTARNVPQIGIEAKAGSHQDGRRNKEINGAPVRTKLGTAMLLSVF
jgi:hypothetical protein